ncbi:MAG: hypothetical protein KDK70_17750, partial [Myxococcales bacterium]|nr:hypothetical protein [Myxococcales bacterium]
MALLDAVVFVGDAVERSSGVDLFHVASMRLSWGLRGSLCEEGVPRILLGSLVDERLHALADFAHGG